MRAASAWRALGPRLVAGLPILLLCLMLQACGSAQRSSPAGVARIDERLPRLAGETVEGEPIDVSELAEGKPLVINVWAHDCAPCREEQPMLVELADRFEGDVRFVGINYQDDRDAARSWIREYDVSYPNLYDRRGRTAVDLGYPFIPDTFVVDAGGTIRWAVFGATDERELGGLIEDVLT
jgi:cytochrome c biogenesis protein CcmG, thiol:disulfide interchange protein DsbE